MQRRRPRQWKQGRGKRQRAPGAQIAHERQQTEQMHALMAELVRGHVELGQQLKELEGLSDAARLTLLHDYAVTDAELRRWLTKLQNAGQP